MNNSHDLRLIIESRIPIIVIETWEERRALTLLSKLGVQLAKPLYAWSASDGLRRADLVDSPSLPQTTSPDPRARS